MQAQSKHYTYKTSQGLVEFWADRGRVFVVAVEKAGDSSAALEDQIKSMPPGEFMARAIAASGEADYRYPDQAFRARQLLERAKEVCLIAWRFGDPTNPKVLAHLNRHRGRSSRIVVPSVDQLPALGGIRYKFDPSQSARDVLLNGANVIPDFTTPPSQLLTPARAEQLRRRRK